MPEQEKEHGRSHALAAAFAAGVLAGAAGTAAVISGVAEPRGDAAAQAAEVVGPVSTEARVAGGDVGEGTTGGRRAAGAAAAAGATEETGGGAGSREAPQRADADEVLAALQALAREDALRAWAETRSEPMPEELLAEVTEMQAHLVRNMAATLARLEAEGRAKGEAADRTLAAKDPFAILAEVQYDHPGLARLVGSAEEFAAWFAPRSAGPTIDGPALVAGTATARLADGAVVAFPTGVFALPNLAARRAAFPQDVTIRGAGPRSTLLVAEKFSARVPVHRLSFEDCTVFAAKGLFRQSEPALVALRRVHVVGFDSGENDLPALAASRAAVLARDCTFASGFGDSADPDAIVLNGGFVLARFERCTFERVSLHGADRNRVFADCTMTDLLDDVPEEAVLVNCRVAKTPEPDQRVEQRRQDLEALFPNWRERVERR